MNSGLLQTHILWDFPFQRGAGALRGHTRKHPQALLFHEAEKMTKIADVEGITIVRLCIKNGTCIC